MKFYKTFTLIIVILFCVCADADVVAVVSSRSPVGALTTEQISDLYLSKLKDFPGGGKAVLVMEQSGPATDEFLSKALNRTLAQAQAYWAKLTFTGKGSAPKEVSSANEMKKLLSENPNLIGYMDKREVDASVKVVWTP